MHWRVEKKDAPSIDALFEHSSNGSPAVMGGMERTSEVGFNNCGFANGCTTLDASSIL
jgi:hypothetical protein